VAPKGELSAERCRSLLLRNLIASREAKGKQNFENEAAEKRPKMVQKKIEGAETFRFLRPLLIVPQSF
jgi:hypothetical protein